jgi:DNA gyrase subunit A
MEEVRVMGRSTQGVRLVNLHEGDVLVAVQKLGQMDSENPVNEGQVSPPPVARQEPTDEEPEVEILDEVSDEDFIDENPEE